MVGKVESVLFAPHTDLMLQDYGWKTTDLMTHFLEASKPSKATVCGVWEGMMGDKCGPLRLRFRVDGRESYWEIHQARPSIDYAISIHLQ